MEFLALAGNDRLKEQLSQQESGRGLAHAYIISGPTGSGRHTLARLLAAAMVCTSDSGGRPCGKCSPCKKITAGIHPDFEIISGPEEGKPITVDQIRALRSDAYIRPNEGDRKIYLLEGADQMNASAQNAMLKLLEEGPGYAVFLLLAENGGGLLQTVRSRCEELVLSPVSVVQCQSWLKDRFPQKAWRRSRQPLWIARAFWAGRWTGCLGPTRKPGPERSRRTGWPRPWRKVRSCSSLRRPWFWIGWTGRS